MFLIAQRWFGEHKWKKISPSFGFVPDDLDPDANFG